MKNYYFTYGTSENFPFQGGWTTVIASNRNLAIRAFDMCHPRTNSDLINCSGVYDAEKFKQSEIFKSNDNLGHGEHEVIYVNDFAGEIVSLHRNRPIEMSYVQMKELFKTAEKNNIHLTGYIVFRADSFDEEYSEYQRTYVVSSNNKAFQEGMFSASVFGSCIDGTDNIIRLHDLFNVSQGNDAYSDWKIEKCYMFI